MDGKPTHRFELRLSSELMDALDEWRRQQPDLPNRTEALRRIIETVVMPNRQGGTTRKRRGKKP